MSLQPRYGIISEESPSVGNYKSDVEAFVSIAFERIGRLLYSVGDLDTIIIVMCNLPFIVVTISSYNSVIEDCGY